MNTAESAQCTDTKSAREPAKPGRSAIEASTDQSTVLVAESTREAQRTSPDEALRMAIKAALDAGDFDRVKALVAVLESSPRPAPVVSIATARPKR